MIVSNSQGLTEQEVKDSIESALAEELGIHPQNIEVSYDKDTGLATYTISSDNAESLAVVQSTLQQEGFANNLNLAQGLAVSEFTAPNEVIANVDISVDASNAADVQSAVAAVEQVLEENNYTYESKGMIFFS